MPTKDQMLFFSPQGASLRFHRDLSRASYVNISFFRAGAAEGNIPLHFSLRGQSDGLVVNTCQEGDWGVEQWHALPDGRAIEIAMRRRLGVGRAQVVLSVDGTAIFSASVSEIEHLSGIDAVTIDGGVVPRSVQVDSSKRIPVRGHLTLQPKSLRLEGWGFRSDRLVQDLEIRIDGLERPLSVACYDRPDVARREGAPTDGIGVSSVLPGWIGERLGSDLETLVCRVFAGGVETGAVLKVSRDEIRRRVELAAQADTDPVSRHLVAEHAHWLWPDLSISAQAVARRAARDLGLPRPGMTDRSAPRGAVSEDAFDTALRRIGARLRQDLDPARALPDPGSVSDAVRWRLALALTGPYCAQDAFETLARWAGDNERDAILSTADGYRSGAVIPWLMQSRPPHDMSALLDRLHLAPGWQVETAALSFWVRDALDRTDLRSDAAALWCRLLRRWAAHPEHRLACRHMLRSAGKLVAVFPLLDSTLQKTISETLVAVYGLSGAFWRERAFPPGSDLEAAQGFSAVLVDAISSATRSDKVEPALQWFEARGAMGTEAMRQALFGPCGRALGSDSSWDAVFADRPDPDGIALRVLAHPFGPDRDSALAPKARRAITARYGAAGLPQAPDAGLQDRATRLVREVLDQKASVEALRPVLAPLARAESVYAGFGLGLVAIAGVSTQGRDAEAAQILQMLRDFEIDTACSAQDLRHMAPLRTARDTLSTASGPVAAEALAAFLPEGENIPVLPARPPGLAESNPVFDTLVCLISCRANLDTRVAAIRSAWLERLTALGIAHVVVVGDGDGTLSDGILALDAPDDYDGLPQKSLALAEWVLERTSFAHLLKIDDDCFLDVDGFFHGWSYRKFDYHGRYLRRVAGQTDRLWHARAGQIVDPDRSPEPSSYADGGSSYTLSRRAMAELTQQARTPAGRALRLHSRMEDKLVGDLLALSGIGPVEEDHVCTIRRRPATGCLPVPKWENGFYPSAATPTRQIHLDRNEDLATATACLGAPGLWPKKIWPSDGMTLRYNSNSLELVSPVDRLRRVVEAPVVVICSLRNEAPMLDAFLSHYRALGVGGFLMADNLSSDGTLERLADEPDVGLFTVDTDYDAGRFGVTWQKTLADTFRTNAWTLVADADELFVCETPGGLPAFVCDPALSRSDAVRTFLLDLYPKTSLSSAQVTDDPFATAGFCDSVPFLADWPGEGVFATTPTWTSALRHRLLPSSPGDRYLVQKFALLRPRPWMQWAPGLHHMGDIRIAPKSALMGHFKYHAGFAQKAVEEAGRERHWGGAAEYRAYAELGVDLQLWDAEVSQPWRETSQVRRILDAGGLP